MTIYCFKVLDIIFYTMSREKPINFQYPHQIHHCRETMSPLVALRECGDARTSTKDHYVRPLHCRISY